WTVDVMRIYPTLTDLCGIPTPSHVQGKSIRSLLTDPKSSWNEPALTTYKYMNHAIRSEGFRYIRYADGGEEFYDEQKDPYEWTNLVTNALVGANMAELAKSLPKTNKPDIGGRRNAGAEAGMPLEEERRAKK